MSISDVAIRRPVFTSMIALCLVVLGIMGVNRLGTDLYPDVTFPVVMVTTVYKGAGPGEIETQVTKPLEDSIAGISGIDKIHSWSRENASTIAVQFKLTESLDRATQEVRDKVAQAQSSLPKDADLPKVSRVDISAAPVLTYAVSADTSSQRLRKLIEDRVQPSLQQIEGVAEARITGGDVREIQVDLDLDKVKAVGTSPYEIAQRIGMENLNLPAGHLALGPTELTVRTLGEFKNVGQLRELPIATSKTGSQVRLDEVATVTDGVAERRTIARLNGRDAIILEVVKQPGSNTVKVADTVVVREAITHRLDRGEDPATAASKGTKEVGLAVLATTLTLVAVFVPVAFMPGIVGQFFKQFGITISAAVLISLFISFTLDPMLSARLAKARKPGEVKKEAKVARVLREAFEATERWYGRVLRTVLKHKWVSLGAAVAVTVVSFAVTSGLRSEFLSVVDRSQFIVDLQLPDSASLDLTGQRAAEAEKLLRAMPEVKDVYAIIGLNGEANKVKMRALTVPKKARKRGILALKDAARSALAKLPATKVSISDPPAIEGLGDFFPIMVRITGPDLKVLNEQGRWIAEALRRIPGTVDVKIESNPPKPELAIAVDRTRAMDLGLSAGQIATQLRLAIDGEVPAKLREGKDETDIRVRLAERDRKSPDRVRGMDLFSPRGVRQLSDLAQVSLQDGPSVIEHENRERQIAVFSQLGTGAALGEVAEKLKAEIGKHPLPAGYSVIYDGQMKTFNEQNEAFSAAFGLAFVFIFMVLASQFESLKHPFTIMVSLPLALIGARLGLLLAGKNLSLGAMIGVILLMGLVTKNAILLVDGALQRLREGDDVDTALLKAGPRRLRPILMTSFAMAIGMVPTAIGSGIGSEFRSPMAIAVIGGVITSTALTLLVVPVIFAGVEKLSFARLLRRKKDRPVLVSAEPPTEEAATTAQVASG